MSSVVNIYKYAHNMEKIIQNHNKEEHQVKLKDVKGIVKDEYMLNLFNSAEGSLDTLKMASTIFDKVFLSVQMRMVIWIVGTIIALILLLFFRHIGLSYWISIPVSLLLTYLIKNALRLLAISLVKRKLFK